MQGVVIKSSTLRSRLFALLNVEKGKIVAGVKPGDGRDIPDWEIENWQATDDFWLHFDVFIKEVQLRYAPIGVSYAIRPYNGGFYLSDHWYEQYQVLLQKHFSDHRVERERDGYYNENTRWYWNVSAQTWIPSTIVSQDFDRITAGLPPVPNVLVDRRPFFELSAWLKILPERGYFILSAEKAKEWGITQSDVFDWPSFWIGFSDTYPFE